MSNDANYAALEGYDRDDSGKKKGGSPRSAGWLAQIMTPRSTIWMFVVVNLLNYLDRGIIPGAPNQFQSFIHSTTNVSESQESTYLGFLQSIFIASFSVAVVGAGNFVHWYPPFRVMGGGLAVWCIAVWISGLSKNMQSFYILVLGRALSGVGEASFQCIAPAFIQDYAPGGRQVLFLGIFFSSITVGTAAGYAYSAVISTSSLGWSWAFYLEGLMMIPFVVVCWFLPYQLSHVSGGSHEVSGPSHEAKEREGAQAVKLSTEVKTIMKNSTFIYISLGYAAYCAVLAGLSTFGPTFFQGLQLFPDEKSASLHFSAIIAIAGIIGTPIGGYISDRMAGGSEASREQVLSTCLMIMSFSSFVGMIFSIMATFCTQRWLFLLLMGTAIMFLFLPTGCCTMAVMLSVPPSMRASAVALNILIMHLLGDVPSPIAVGALKDYLAPHCNTVRIDGQDVLNPLCVEDGDGLRMTLVASLGWLIFTVIFWTLPLLREIPKASDASAPLHPAAADSAA